MFIKQLFLCFILFSCKLLCLGQEKWASPELEQMHNNVLAYEKLGNYKDAIVTLKQLMSIAPGMPGLKTELGNLYYLSGSYELGVETLNPLIDDGNATDSTYYLLASCQIERKQYKQAGRTLDKGLKKYLCSGLLLHTRGQLFLHNNDADAAIVRFISGINRAPEFKENYLAACHTMLGKGKEYPMLTLALKFGETYLVMRADTSGNDSLKQIIYNGWGMLFNSLAAEININDSSLSIYRELTPVISDGITTENLTMVSTRLLMKFNDTAAFQDALFTYQLELIRNGWFDIYNEWLFGKAEHMGQYDGWNKFHKGDMERFEQWREAHLLKIEPPQHVWRTYPISVQRRKPRKEKTLKINGYTNKAYK